MTAARPASDPPPYEPNASIRPKRALDLKPGLGDLPGHLGSTPEPADERGEALSPVVPANFWLTPDVDVSDITEDYDASIEALAKNPRGSTGAWIIRSFLELRRLGYPVSLGSHLRPGAINFVDGFSFGRRRRATLAFVAMLRSDAHFSALGNVTIHQNHLLPETRTNLSIAHWPQPGLVPRRRDREPVVRRMGFKGEPFNLDPAFRAPEVLARLSALGVDFDLPVADRVANARNWRDYSECDAIVAVRNLTVTDAQIKPATKLINAWLAGTPAILGPEPAFRELRRSDLDFLEVRTPGEFLEAVRYLNSDPSVYRAFVENGRRRSEDFTAASTAARWIEMIRGPISEAYAEWHSRSRVHKLAWTVAAMLEEPKRKRRHTESIFGGARILDEFR